MKATDRRGIPPDATHSPEPGGARQPSDPRPAAGTEESDGAFAEEFQVSRDPRPLIPDGVYEAVCNRAEVVEFFKFGRARKIILHFEIYGGDHTGSVLFLAMACPRVGGKVGIGSKLYANYLIANGGIAPGRRDRMTLSIFKRRMFRVMVKTVKPRFEDGAEKPGRFHYSIISELIERLA